jgi:hypothetical protein
VNGALIHGARPAFRKLSGIGGKYQRHKRFFGA